MSNDKEKKPEGLRYNNGKIRHDLLEPFAINELAKVFTKGSEKYEPNNWLKGMKWSTMIASLKRHLNAFERGEDFDNETHLYHMAHVAWNAMALVSYYKHHPGMDDRFSNTHNHPRIGLDIDEICADWVKAYTSKYKLKIPNHWSFDRALKERLSVLKKDKNFWLSIPAKINPVTDLPFEPHCYITSRVIPTAWTEEWLHNNGFPSAPVYTVGHERSKVEVAKESGIEWFVDDNYNNFIELNRAGIFTFLFDAEHNRKYNVGHRRIYSLKDILKF